LQNIRGPSRLQKYAWPAIWQGSDVIGVCPSDKKHPQNSGKTTSYLLPLSFMLNNKDIYCSLPKYGLGVSFNFSTELHSYPADQYIVFDGFFIRQLLV